MNIRNFEATTMTATDAALTVIERNIIGAQPTEINRIMEHLTERFNRLIKTELQHSILSNGATQDQT